MYTFLKSGSGINPVKSAKYRYPREPPKRKLSALAGFLALGFTWQTAAYFKASPVFPPLDSVIREIFCLLQDKTFIPHIEASMKIILSGIGMAAVVGLAVGLLLFRYQRIRQAVLPIIECIRGIAALTLFPLLIITFGLGTFSRVFVIFWTAWPPIVLTTINCLNVDSGVIDAARICGSGEWRTIVFIRIPMSMRDLITGIRIGFGGGWVSLITAEMLGASKGLGFYLLWSSQTFEFKKVYAVIIIIAAIGGLMNIALLVTQGKTSSITGETE